MEAVKESMSQMSEMFHKKLAEFENRQQSMGSPASSGASNLAAEFSTFKALTLSALRTLQTQVELLVNKTDNLEMYSRRKILLLHGVPEDKKEDTAAVIAKEVVHRLKLSDFIVTDITRCHRMGRLSTSDRPRPLLFKLRDMSLRGKIWSAKTNLKGSGITMSEFLTKSRHDTFMAARQLFGVAKSWTRDGFVYVLGADGARHRICCLEELAKLGVSAPPVVAVATTSKKTASTIKETTVAAKQKRAATVKK